MSHALRRRILAALAAIALSPVAVGQEAGEGWVVASLLQEGAVSEVTLDFKEKDSGAFLSDAVLSMTLSIFVKDDIDAEGRKGRVVVKALKPGTYVLSSVRMAETIANRKWNVRNLESATIDVRAGEVTYLGELVGTGTLSKPFLGVRAIEKPYVLVADQRARDLPIAEAKDPAIAGKPVRSLAPFLPKGGSRIFYAKKLPDAE